MRDQAPFFKIICNLEAPYIEVRKAFPTLPTFLSTRSGSSDTGWGGGGVRRHALH